MQQTPPHQMEWKSLNWDRPSCTTAKATIHHVRELEHCACVASPLGPVYTWPLQSGLCAAYAIQPIVGHLDLLFK